MRYLAGDVRVDAVHERVEGGAHGALGAVGGVQLEGVEQHLVQVHVLHRACRLVRVVDQTLQTHQNNWFIDSPSRVDDIIYFTASINRIDIACSKWNNLHKDDLTKVSVCITYGQECVCKAEGGGCKVISDRGVYRRVVVIGIALVLQGHVQCKHRICA